MTTARPAGLLWLDLETTGLEPRDCCILEVGARVAAFDTPFDGDLVCDRVVHAVVSEKKGYLGDTLIGVQNYTGLGGRGTYLIDKFVLDMHTKNGLLRDCVESTNTLREVEEGILLKVPDLPREERFVLAGSTVHFDRSFLQRYMPTLHARLSHRHYDASSVKLFCQSLDMPPLPKAEAHRALADVDESIAHARACAEWATNVLGHAPGDYLGAASGIRTDE